MTKPSLGELTERAGGFLGSLNDGVSANESTQEQGGRAQPRSQGLHLVVPVSS